MKLSLPEAIRRGAKLRPQYKYGNFFGMPERGRMGTCALGAAIEAVTGVSPEEGEPDDIHRVYSYGFLFDTWRGDEAAFDIATHDNDCNGLTREEIADKLEAMGY